MTVFVALLRAVNVGGTGKLPMSDLVRLAEAAGFRRVQTYIASGNVIFETAHTAGEVKATLEQALAEYAGKPVGVMVRTADELAAVLSHNPFPDAPPNRTAVIFLDAAPPADLQVTASSGEEVKPGKREIYVYYPDGMGNSKLKIPVAKSGTARNINTVSRLVKMSSALMGS